MPIDSYILKAITNEETLKEVVKIEKVDGTYKLCCQNNKYFAWSKIPVNQPDSKLLCENYYVLQNELRKLVKESEYSCPLNWEFPHWIIAAESD